MTVLGARQRVRARDASERVWCARSPRVHVSLVLRTGIDSGEIGITGITVCRGWTGGCVCLALLASIVFFLFALSARLLQLSFAHAVAHRILSRWRDADRTACDCCLAATLA